MRIWVQSPESTLWTVAMQHVLISPAMRSWRQVRPVFTGQTVKFLTVLKSNERPYLKEQSEWFLRNDTQGCLLVFAGTHMHNHLYAHSHTHIHTHVSSTSVKVVTRINASIPKGTKCVSHIWKLLYLVLKNKIQKRTKNTNPTHDGVVKSNQDIKCTKE